MTVSKIPEDFKEQSDAGYVCRYVSIVADPLKGGAVVTSSKPFKIVAIAEKKKEEKKESESVPQEKKKEEKVQPQKEKEEAK